MKKFKFAAVALTMVALGLIIVAADHIDAPAVQGGSSDITDFYAFQGEDNSNMVFAVNLQGLMSPAATEAATFDENVLVEINIDTDGDFIEDLVIQAIPRNGRMHVFGPAAPASTGTQSTINSTANQTIVDITGYNDSPRMASNGGVTVFAGPRDDPFFMDFARYGEVVGGTAPGFNDPGSDTFAGTNVMSIVIEVAKNMIGSTGTINTWVETKEQ